MKMRFPIPSSFIIMIIRNLQKNDNNQVALLIKQLTQNIIEPENLVKRIEGLTEQKNSQFLVAELYGKIIGFGGLTWHLIPSKGLIAWVEEVVVDSQSRRKGVGKDLMEHLLKLAKQKKIKQIKLTSTPMAKSLYEKLGFIKKDNEYLIKSLV